MFGVIVSSRPVITEAQTISPTQLAFNIPTSPAFGHIVVFLLPGSELPAGSGAAVYAQPPNSPEVKFLGAISNGKPSAIFKVNSKGPGTSIGPIGNEAMVNEPGATMALGICLESFEQIQQSMAALESGISGQKMALVHQPASNTPNNTKILAQRIIANAYNFLAGFSGNVGPNGIEVIPLKSLEDWWKKFEKKVEMDPGFLERSD